MRLALASLIALGAVSTAVAQEQTAAPAPAAAPAQAPAAAPAPATAQTTPAAPAAPADQAAPPVAAPAAGAAPADTYVAPTRGPRTTDPLSVRLMDVLDKICKPSVAGGDMAALAKDYGFKKKKEQWVFDLGKPY